MAGTIKGRLLVTLSSSGGSTDRKNIALFYRSVYDFLKVQVEPEGYVTEIAGYGSNTDPIGPGAFSVWRWNTSSLRNWEWYMLIQMTSGSTVPANALPVTIEGGSSTFNNMGFAAAVGINHVSGTYSFFNPWNGTTGSFTSDSKGNPVWGTTASNPGSDVHLAVLPRSNVSESRIGNTRGPASAWTEQSDLSGFTSGFSGQYGNGLLLNMWADEDSFLVVIKDDDSHDHGHMYIGPYRPIPSLSASIPAPLIMYRRFWNGNEDLFDFDSGQWLNEGIGGAITVFPMTNTLSSSELFLPTCGVMVSYPPLFGTILPNRQAQIALATTSSFYDAVPIFIHRWERPLGIVGMFSSSLLRLISGVGGDTFRYATSNSGSSELRRAFFPVDNTVEAAGTYSVPWSGSLQPNTGSGIFPDISGGFRF